MKNKKKPASFEKPLIFSNNQQGLILREYKFKLKLLISINEDLLNQKKIAKDSINTYKKSLSLFLGNKKNTKYTEEFKKLLLKVIESISEDNSKIKQYTEKSDQDLASLNSQLLLFQSCYENRSSFESENEMVQMQLFYFKNAFDSKKNLEQSLNSAIQNLEKKQSEKTFEDHESEDNICLYFMDESLKGLRSDMSLNMKKLLKVRSDKEAHIKKLSDLEKELYQVKQNKYLETVNNTYALESPYLNTEIKSTNNSTTKSKQSERYLFSLLRKKSSSKEDKIKILISLQNEINKNLSLIDNLADEINEEKNKFNHLQGNLVNMEHLFKLKNELIHEYENHLEELTEKKETNLSSDK